MINYLYSIDVAIFYFINHTLSNPVLDWLMPFLTNLNKDKFFVALVIVFIVFLLIRGDRTVRVTVGLLIVTILLSDQISSFIIKPLVGRIRPCAVLADVRLLVDCGSGLSFPSSHAVNNFAGATLITRFYPKQKVYWFSFASLIALSRPYVGVHYPSDIVAGGIIGSLIAVLVYALWRILERTYFQKNLFQI